MPKFSKRSMDNLNTCEMDLQVLMWELIKHFDVAVIQGYRTPEEQAELYASGRTKPGPIVTKIDGVNRLSKHNHYPSRAVDIVPYPINWRDTNRFYLMGGFVKALAVKLKEEGKINHDIRWGGDWDGDTMVDDQTFMDLPHFELV